MDTPAGLDTPFVNNYGVWLDEFSALGLSHTLERSWNDAVCYFGEAQQKRLGRGYGRVSRRKLREHMLRICKEAGVAFLPGDVANISVSEGQQSSSRVTTTDGKQLDARCVCAHAELDQGVGRSTCRRPGGQSWTRLGAPWAIRLFPVATHTCSSRRIVTLAAGAAAGKFLRYEEGAPSVAAQTAYGIEAEVDGYDEGGLPSCGGAGRQGGPCGWCHLFTPLLARLARLLCAHAAYNANEMLFMDFRRHHTGVWGNGSGKRLQVRRRSARIASVRACVHGVGRSRRREAVAVLLCAPPRVQPGAHPNAGDGVWGTSGEVPSFLYAMPLGGNRVFLEETCLVAKPALPFAVLKRRL